MSVKDRLLQFIQFKGVAVSVFEKECSLSNGYINKTKSVSADMCSQILAAYPDLSAEWLLRDKGGMLLSPATSIEITDSPQANSEIEIELKNNRNSFNSNSHVNTDENETINKLLDLLAEKDKQISTLLSIIAK